MSEGRWQLSLFGRFQLRCADEIIPVPASAQRVLAYLAVYGPSVRPVVAGTLWPFAAEFRAQGNLRSALWRLSQRGQQVVDSRFDLLALSATVTVDILEFAAGARCLLGGSGEPGWADSVVLTADTLLPDWDEEWVRIERERLHQLRLHALETFARRLSRERQHAAALDAALLAVRLEPLRESAHRAVLTVHLAAGDPATAARHFEAFRALLRRELGIEPSRRMRAMVQSA
ncbi:MAG: transcriptional regulator [Kutzneria sp.]|nr:transcriptional regulator [Kutzneria sp.]